MHVICTYVQLLCKTRVYSTMIDSGIKIARNINMVKRAHVEIKKLEYMPGLIFGKESKSGLGFETRQR